MTGVKVSRAHSVSSARVRRPLEPLTCYWHDHTLERRPDPDLDATNPSPPGLQTSALPVWFRVTMSPSGDMVPSDSQHGCFRCGWSSAVSNICKSPRTRYLRTYLLSQTAKVEAAEYQKVGTHFWAIAHSLKLDHWNNVHATSSSSGLWRLRARSVTGVVSKSQV